MFPHTTTRTLPRRPTQFVQTRSLAGPRGAIAASAGLTRRSLLVCLAILIGGACTDSELTAPKPQLSRPHFAQGDDGVWTVTSLDDPGDGVCDDDCTLREAIADAQSGDRIVFENGLSGDILLNSGQLRIVDKSISIDGANRIRIDADHRSRVFLIEDDPQSGVMEVELTNLVLLRGANEVPAVDGGALFIGGGKITLTNVEIADSRAVANGGAMAVTDGVVRIERSHIVGNQARAANGGAIWNSRATVELVDTRISENRAVQGGALYSDRGVTTITSSTISGNSASESGGGIALTDATLRMARSTVSGNTVTGMPTQEPIGGGIALFRSSVAELGSVTITANTVIEDTGAQMIYVTDDARLTISNSIVGGGGNAQGLQCEFTSTVPVASGGYNIVTPECAAASPALTDITVAPAVMYTQVLDPNLSDNGGPTETHALWPEGLAVDAGYCPSLLDRVDQRGVGRPIDIPSKTNVADGCDIGAYEVAAGVTRTADLIVSQSVDKTSVKQGALLTYTVRVRNLGPDASNVVVSNQLSSGVTFVDARPSKGTTTAPPKGETGTVTWNVGQMESGDDETAEIQVTVLVRGKTTITNVATVSGDVTDPVPGNNSASITVTVAPGNEGSGNGNGGSGNGGNGNGGNGNGNGPKK